MSRRQPNPAFPAAIVIDTREQLPFSFAAIPADKEHGGGTWQVTTERRTLPSGDYSLAGFETRVAVERKSVSDLFGTISQGRDRFVRELERLAEYDYAAVVIEGDWQAITASYPPAMLDLREHLAAAARSGDESQPWQEWLQALIETTPGPPARSQLPPRIVYRSVLAWQQRYPRVHWWPCPDRDFAEVTTFRILERFLKEEQAKWATTCKRGVASSACWAAGRSSPAAPPPTAS